MKKKKKGAFENKLKAYSAAAAGTLLLVPSAHAAIQYSGPQNIVVDAVSGATAVVDLDGNATSDFTFYYFVTPYHRWHEIDSNGVGNSIIDTLGSYPYAVNLPANYTIEGTLATGRYWYSWGILDSTSYGNGYGNFLGQSGYIGVRFSAGCGTAYGWIQYDGTNAPASGTIIDWAYEDTCTPILAGAGAPPAVPVPTLNQWGILILIALLAGAGTWMLRKKEEV